MGASWGLFWASRGPEACSGPLGGPWGLSGASWGLLFPLLDPSWGRLGALCGRLGRLLGRLEAVLGRPGVVLGASYASSGRSWGPLGPSWSVGKPKKRKRQKPSKTNKKSHQPSGRRWFKEFPLPTPFFPFGEGFTPPPTPSPGPGRGVSRRVGASKMAQDGSKSASESPR